MKQALGFAPAATLSRAAGADFFLGGLGELGGLGGLRELGELGGLRELGELGGLGELGELGGLGVQGCWPEAQQGFRCGLFEHGQCLVFGGLHLFALAGAFVVDAAEVEDAVNDDAVELVGVFLAEELGV